MRNHRESSSNRPPPRRPDDRWRRHQARHAPEVSAEDQLRRGSSREVTASDLLRPAALVDAVILRRHEWTWGVVPYTLFILILRPADEEPFSVGLRFSDLAELERHHTIVQARADGQPKLPRVPPPHSLPVVGKFMDSQRSIEARGLAIQLYVHALLAAGGGVRSVALDFLRERADD